MASLGTSASTEGSSAIRPVRLGAAEDGEKVEGMARDGLSNVAAEDRFTPSIAPDHPQIFVSCSTIVEDRPMDESSASSATSLRDGSFAVLKTVSEAEGDKRSGEKESASSPAFASTPKGGGEEGVGERGGSMRDKVSAASFSSTSTTSLPPTCSHAPVTSSSTCPSFSRWTFESTGPAIETSEAAASPLPSSASASGAEEALEEEAEKDGAVAVNRIVIQKHEQRLIVKTPEGEESEKVIVSRFSKSREASPALHRRGGGTLRPSHSAGSLGGTVGEVGAGRDGEVGFVLSLPPEVESGLDHQYLSSQDL